jgi:hypothetical protein
MHMSPDGLIPAALGYSLKNVEHVMDVSKERLLMAFFSMTNFAVKQMIEYDRAHSDFPATVGCLRLYDIAARPHAIDVSCVSARTDRELHLTLHAREHHLVDEWRRRVEMPQKPERLHPRHHFNRSSAKRNG